ncbi:MAG: hypothetical protein ACW98F_06750 [Candidatus Hodarchaeales archaeon]
MVNQEKSQINALEKEGWVKKFSVEVHRVDEYVELYKSLGLEVRVEPVIPDERKECQICFEAECDRFKIIYTR